MTSKITYQDMNGKEYTVSEGENGVQTVQYDTKTNLITIQYNGSTEYVNAPYVRHHQKTLTDAEYAARIEGFNDIFNG